MSKDSGPLKVIVIGYGRMGKRHAEVYAASSNFKLVGVCGRSRQRNEIESTYADAAFYDDLSNAIANEHPDLVCISTHIDSHDHLSRFALENGCHVFLEKPITPTVDDSRALLAFAQQTRRKLVVGYILHHDQLWTNFIKACNELEGPIKIEIQLDQHSSGKEWEIHKKILQNSSIATDCAIHFFDIMSQAINAEARQVTGSSARTHNIESIGDNFLSATVEFADGSTGSYSSAWGPGFEESPVSKISASNTNTAVSIVESGANANIIKADLDGSEQTIYSEMAHLENATRLQQDFVFRTISDDCDLELHHQRALACMQIAAAADQSIRASEPIRLDIE